MAEKNVILKDTMGNTLYPEIADNSVTKVKLSNGVLDDVTSITWYELKQLRDLDNLTPGHQYRITDYLCTTTQKDTKSTGHQFDIIVTADSTNKLNEKARACPHDGDNYFKDSNLAAWQLWYSLDNDISRFAWADDDSGKGVIYRMIDEFNNDCPYDFKNIQFRRWKITKASISSMIGKYYAMADTVNFIGWEVDSSDSKYFYTFSYLGEMSDLVEYKGDVLEDASIIGNTINGDPGVNFNSIKDFTNSHTQLLNNIVFFTFINSNVYHSCYLNSFNNDCALSSIGPNCYSNLFGNNCKDIILDGDCVNNSFTECSNIYFGAGCSSNISKNGMFCMFNSSCTNNLIYCSDTNILGQDCDFNVIKYSDTNMLGQDCDYNVIKYSDTSMLGQDCDYNVIKYSSNNIFGNYCQGNVLENSFYIKLLDYYKNNKFDAGASYVIFNGNGTKSSYIQNYHIKQSMVFDEGSEYTITAKPGLNYVLSVAKRSDGTVVEYNEADTHKLVSITDSDYTALTTKDSNTLYCIPE